MRAPRSIFWLNNARSGAENLGELNDPRQTCIAIYAGDHMADARAAELGIMQYFYGGGAQAQRRGSAPETIDPHAMAEEAAKGSEAVRQSYYEHQPVHAISIEERAYVENAMVAGHRVTEAERRVAGQLGAEFTGPSPSEVTEAGGDYQAAAEKAAQAQGLTGEPPKPEEPKPPESPPAPPTPPSGDNPGETPPRRPVGR